MQSIEHAEHRACSLVQHARQRYSTTARQCRVSEQACCGASWRCPHRARLTVADVGHLDVPLRAGGGGGGGEHRSVESMPLGSTGARGGSAGLRGFLRGGRRRGALFNSALETRVCRGNSNRSCSRQAVHRQSSRLSRLSNGSNGSLACSRKAVHRQRSASNGSLTALSPARGRRCTGRS